VPGRGGVGRTRPAPLRNTFAVIVAAVLGFALATACRAAESKPRLNPHPAIPQDDVVVYTESVLDFGARAGAEAFDNAAAFQAAIDRAHGNGGGIVYVPSGIYYFQSNLVLKTGIRLRGEWRDPDVSGQEKAAGSILAITAGHGKDGGRAFLTIGEGATVRKLSFWYPRQSFEKPVPYPWTIDGSGAGPEMTEVTLYNSFRGIRTAGTEMQVIRLRATCLNLGCHVHGAGNWSWFIDDGYSSRYWERSALPGSPATDEQATTLRAYMRRHMTGMLFEVSKAGILADGGNIYDLRVEDARTALETHWSWFQALNVRFKDVGVGWLARPATGHGRRGGDAKVRIVGGMIDVLPGQDTCGVRGNGHGVHLLGVTIRGEPAYAVDSNRDVTLVQCRFENWTQAGVRATGGTPLVAGCEFGKDADSDIVLGSGVGSASIAGNTFAGKAGIAQRKVSRGVVMDAQPLDMPDLPAWATTYKLAIENKPACPDRFFPVTDFGAQQGDRGQTDCTDAFRGALAAAREAGGGTVFVPGGWWRLDGQIAVPAGVELRGCGAGMHTSIGSTLFSYAHKDDEKGEPFITLEAESGLRGLILYHPGMGKRRDVRYPWAIRGAGKGIWVREVRLANPWNGIDLGTHRCDGFVLTRLIGDTRRNAIRVSGGTTGGRIEYTGWWWTGDFKGFPNGPTGYSDAGKGEVTSSTTWAIRMGHAQDITLLCPNTYLGAGPEAALLSFINEGGVAKDIKVIGPEADAFPFLRAAACGKVDIVSAGTYGSLVHSCGQDVSFYCKPDRGQTLNKRPISAHSHRAIYQSLVQNHAARVPACACRTQTGHRALPCGERFDGGRAGCHRAAKNICPSFGQHVIFRQHARRYCPHARRYCPTNTCDIARVAG
jgi:hypothetical protein